MNRIVREHYPVEKLPEDLREGLEGLRQVTVTIETNDRPEATAAIGDEQTVAAGMFSQFKQIRRSNFATDGEVDAYVQALRDEWSDRER